MSADTLAEPPLLTTNIPTNDFVITGDRPPVGNSSVLNAATRARYSNFGGYLTGVTRIPAGFSDKKYRNGLFAVALHPKADEIVNATAAFHPPAGHVPAYSNGWTLSTKSLTNTYWQSLVYYQAPPPVIVGAQRLGSRIYVVNNYQRVQHGTPEGIRAPAPEVQYSATGLVRVNSVDDITVEEYPVNAWNWIPIYANGAAEMFVSDDEYPFVWLRESVANQQYVTGFWDKPDAFPAMDLTYDPMLGYRRGSSPILQEGQLGNYRQRIPDVDGKIASVFVHPWSAGDYGAPELWHIVNTDGDLYEVYRGEWMAGAVTDQVYTYFDGSMADDDGRASRYPRYNRHGYGFNMNCFNDAHRVTRFTLPGAKDMNLAPDIRFMRDPGQPGVMHLAAVQVTRAPGSH